MRAGVVGSLQSMPAAAIDRVPFVASAMALTQFLHLSRIGSLWLGPCHRRVVRRHPMVAPIVRLARNPCRVGCRVESCGVPSGPVSY